MIKSKYLIRAVFFMVLFASMTVGLLINSTNLNAACFSGDSGNDGYCIESTGGPWYCVSTTHVVSTPCNIVQSARYNEIYNE